MIIRTLISFVVLLALFAGAVKYDVLKYNKVSPDYFIKSERYAYSDTIQRVDIAMVGTSLSAGYYVPVSASGTFINLSMTGRSAIDGMNVINASGKYPKVLLVEANLFDNPVDSSLTDKVFYPGLYSVKKQAFFLQREFKLHQLLPRQLLNLNERLMAGIATRTRLYSNEAKEQSSSNAEWKEAHIRSYNIHYHSTLSDTIDVYNKSLLFRNQLQYLKSMGVKIILFYTPVVSKIEASERTAYKRKLVSEMADDLKIPVLSVPDMERYQTYVAKGDGIHMNGTGTFEYQTFLNDTLPTMIAK